MKDLLDTRGDRTFEIGTKIRLCLILFARDASLKHDRPITAAGRS